MRVLHAMAGARRGGAEAFFARFVRALARRGVEQRALVRAEPARLAALSTAGAPADAARFGGPFDLVTALRFARAIRRFRPAIVMTWLGRASAACPRGRFVHVGRLGGPYDLRRFRRCDHLVVNTRGLGDWAVGQGWPAAKVHVLGNFADEAPAPPIARAALATPERARVVLALGRLHPAKGFDVLIEAVVRLPDIVVWLAGEGPLQGPLEDLARRRGIADRIRFLGWRDDAGALLASADVLVCPSRREPLGNVVLEAWAHGVPVVAAAAAGPAELITPEADGVLVPIDDPDALAAALRRVLGDASHARSLVAAGRRTYEQEHSEAIVVERAVALFRGLAA
ncbi:MAG: glycosyltransferase [Alphaproteobacteria bacterium]